MDRPAPPPPRKPTRLRWVSLGLVAVGVLLLWLSPHADANALAEHLGRLVAGLLVAVVAATIMWLLAKRDPQAWHAIP
jgi:hypothetical protein